MKISDEARMDIAGRLRNAVESSGELPGVPDSEIFCILGIGTGFADGFADKEDVEVVADLIDRETCTIVEDGDGHSCCSRCGADYLCMSDASFCPDCGRKVVRNGDQR